jgi:hypothetical protein
MAMSPSCAGCGTAPADLWRGTEYHRGRTLDADEGVVEVPYLVLLVVAVVVVVLVMRAAGAPPGARGTGGAARAPRRPRPQRTTRSLPPDDDPEFLRELERRTRRDDGSPA